MNVHNISSKLRNFSEGDITSDNEFLFLILNAFTVGMEIISMLLAMKSITQSVTR